MIEPLSTYHCPVAALWTESGGVGRPAGGKCLSKDYDANAVLPPQREDQWPEQTGDDVCCREIDAEPEEEHLNIALLPPSMLLLR